MALVICVHTHVCVCVCLCVCVRMYVCMYVSPGSLSDQMQYCNAHRAVLSCLMLRVPSTEDTEPEGLDNQFTKTEPIWACVSALMCSNNVQQRIH